MSDDNFRYTSHQYPSKCSSVKANSSVPLSTPHKCWHNSDQTHHNEYWSVPRVCLANRTYTYWTDIILFSSFIQMLWNPCTIKCALSICDRTHTGNSFFTEEAFPDTCVKQQSYRIKQTATKNLIYKKKKKSTGYRQNCSLNCALKGNKTQSTFTYINGYQQQKMVIWNSSIYWMQKGKCL
jgi:hypothetical protein